MRVCLRVAQALHVRLSLHLGRVWKRMCAEPHTTLMDFPTALRETHVHMQRALRQCGAAPWRLETLIAHLEKETAPQPLLDAARDSFGPIGDVVGDCVVRPAAWAISASFSLLWGGVHAVIGLCFSPQDGAGGWGLDEPAVDHKGGKGQ